MKNSEQSLWMPNFSHIYIEQDVLEHENTQKILSHFKTSKIISINSYKEIFNRKGQDLLLQKQSIKLILAKKRDHFLYKGAEVCEDFGNEHFYYTASLMNCVYNCEYCYLQGMYPSGYIVIFVNIEDTFNDIKKKLSLHKNLYLCISYDTDLLAMEGIVGFVDQWLDFAQQNPKLKIELRTKCSNYKVFEHRTPLDNFILSWTLSPTEIIHQYEINISSLKKRLEAVRKTIKMGWKVRVCFDPILHVNKWQQIYDTFIEHVFNEIDGDKVKDISIGVFRISKEYMKNIHRIRPDSKILNDAFVCNEGVITYKDQQKQEMIHYMLEKIKPYVKQEKIYY